MSTRVVPNVVKVICHQSQYGAQAVNGKHFMKPTDFLTKLPCIANALTSRCTSRRKDEAKANSECYRPEGGKHQQCYGIHARNAQVHPGKLCQAVLEGSSTTIQGRRILETGLHGSTSHRRRKQHPRDTVWTSSRIPPALQG